MVLMGHDGEEQFGFEFIAESYLGEGLKFQNYCEGSGRNHKTLAYALYFGLVP